MDDDTEKLPPPPGGYCPDDFAQPEAKYKDERPYRKGDEARRFRRRR